MAINDAPETVIITGGLGFLGLNLSVLFAREGRRVIVVDPADPRPATQILHNEGIKAGSWRAEPGEVFIMTAKIETLEWPTAMLNRLGKPWIFHLASHASPIAYRRRSLETLSAGSLGTHAACGLAMRTEGRLLLTSTSEVYGDPEVHPQPESYRGNVDPVGPRSMYDESKRYAEAVVAAYCHDHAMDGRIVRIFNTYGPGMPLNDGRMIPSFIKACRDGEPITVHGDGSQTRSLCYVSDMLAGLMAVMEAPNEAVRDRSNRPLPVNLGNTDERTVEEVAEQVRSAWHRVTGSEAPPLRFAPQPDPHDPRRRCPDITRALTDVGWRGPVVSLMQGLNYTVHYNINGES